MHAHVYVRVCVYNVIIEVGGRVIHLSFLEPEMLDLVRRIYKLNNNNYTCNYTESS